jgi:tetratricopeptide (TPR) repeat protein
MPCHETTNWLGCGHFAQQRRHFNRRNLTLPVAHRFLCFFARSELDLHPAVYNHPGSRMPEKSFAKKKLTREEERELDIKIGFMEGVVRRDPGFVEALQILGDDYTRRGRYIAGLKVDEQLSQLRPVDPLVQYNLACSYSLTGNYNQAIAALEKALTLGYRDFKWLSEDPDLTDLRLHPLYKNIRATVRRLQAQKD